MARVGLERLSKRFGQTTAVDDVTLDVADGELLVLVGPSGCGKSTVLRLIAGLEEATSGTIRIGERAVNGVPPRDRDIAMVFQSYALYPHMSVRENLAFGLKLRGMAGHEVERRVSGVAETLGLGQLLGRRPAQLSGGQRQRVALGRAMVREPRVFLMDEPLSNLDAQLRVQTRAELIRLHRRLGTTTVYVTHDQVEAMTMGQRVAVLKDGRLQQVGAPLELYERPVNRFVAGFIGSPSMSFIPAELAGGEQGGRELRAPGLRIPVPPSLAARLHAKSGAVVVGLRPEHVGEPSRFGDAKPLTRAQVTLVEQLGSEAFVHLQLEEVELLARYEAHSAPRAGETVDVAFAADAIHLFDAEDGRALISSAPERKSPWDSAGSSPSAAIA